MRRALVIAAHYPPGCGYPNDPNWAADAELLAARLAQQGYQSERIAAAEGLDGLRERLRVLPPEDAALVYFAGFLVLTNTGEPALLFGGSGTQTLGLRALVRRLASLLTKALLVLDVRAGSVVESAVEVGDAVLAERALSAADDAAVDLLLRLDGWGNAVSGSTPALHDAIGRLAHEPHAVTTRDLANLFSELDPKTAIHWREHDAPFVVLPERRYSSLPTALPALPTLSIAVAAAPPPRAKEAPSPSRAPPKPGKSRPPPKPTHERASSTPPPKPTSLPPLGESLTQPSGPIQPMPVRALVAPPPGKPELQPPPPSWTPGSLEPLPTNDSVPKDEAGLDEALARHSEPTRQRERIALLEAFLERHPASGLGLQRLEQELTEAHDWARLAETYERLLPGQTEHAVAVALCARQARLCSEVLDDPARAVPFLERATELEPDNLELQLEAGRLYERLQRTEGARAHYLAALRAAPLEPEVFVRLGAFFARRREPDRTWLARAVLHGLDAGTAEQGNLYETRPRGTLPKAVRPLRAEDWMLGLEPGADDPALTILLELVSNLALSWVKPDRRKLLALRGEVQLEPVATSTTTLARILAWTAQLFSVPPPALYLAQGASPPEPLAIVEPAWLVGRELGRGTSQAELAFLWARSLTRHTGTARVLRLFPDRARQETLLAGCFVATRKPPTSKSPQAIDLALTVRQGLSSEALNSLGALLSEGSFEDWQQRLDHFVSQATLCSNRAGLVAASDPSIAAEVLARMDLPDEELERQVADLFTFALGEEYTELRRRLGIEVGTFDAGQ